MCEVTNAEKLQSLPVKRKGDALSFFSTNMGNCTSYGEAVMKLRDCYKSDEKRARILTAWKYLTLKKAMGDNPTQSEVAVFRSFVAKLRSLKQQLYPEYQTDSILKDRRLTEVDIPSIQTTMRDRMPRSEQQAASRIANQLSEKPNSAGSSSACIIEGNEDKADPELL